MRFFIELSDAQAAKLRAQAAQLGINPEQLAHAAVSDLVEVPDSQFQSAAAHVLRKNEELYKRLS